MSLYSETILDSNNNGQNRESHDKQKDQVAFINIRKHIFKRDQQQTLRYQESFRKCFDKEMDHMQLRRDILLQQIHQPAQSSASLQFYSLLRSNDDKCVSPGKFLSPRDDPPNLFITSATNTPNGLFNPIHKKLFPKYPGGISSPGSSSSLGLQVTKSQQQSSNHILSLQEQPKRRKNIVRINQTLLSSALTQNNPSKSIMKGAKQNQELLEKTKTNPLSLRDTSLNKMKNKSLQSYDLTSQNQVAPSNKPIIQARMNFSSSNIFLNNQNNLINSEAHSSSQHQFTLSKGSMRHLTSAKMANNFFLGSRSSSKQDISKETTEHHSIGNEPYFKSPKFSASTLSQETQVSKADFPAFRSSLLEEENIPLSQQVHNDFAEKKEVMRRVEQKLITTLTLSDLFGKQQCLSPENSASKQKLFLNFNCSPRQIWSRSKKHSEEMDELNAQKILEFKRKSELRKASNVQPFSSVFFPSEKEGQQFISERNVLIIEIYNLQRAKSSTSLKYCYQPLPQVSPKQLEIQQKKDFKNFKNNILKQLHITSDDIFLYLKDGTPIYSQADVPRQQCTLFAGNCRMFSGIDKLFSSETNLKSLKTIIEKLEEPVAQALTDIQASPIVLITDSQGGTPSSSHFFGRVSTPQLIRHQSIPQFSAASTPKESTPSSSSKHTRQGSTSKGQNKRSQFADYMKSDESELNNVSEQSSGDVSTPFHKINDVNGYLKKVMKYLDLFFSKFDFNWRTDQEKLEIDLYLKHYLNQPKHIKKHNIINYKLKGFVQRKAHLESLKMLNLDLFTHSIGGILKEFEMKESDLNCVYLLYRSILNIQSLIFSIEQVVKEDDVFTSLQTYDSFTQENLIIVQSLCQYKEIINWGNFVQVLNKISSRNAQQKIELFVKVFDSDSSGTLSYNEVSQFSYQTLQIIINYDKYPNIFTELHQYFLKLLFASLKEEGQTEIPLEKIQRVILEHTECADLLCFFCGTEVSPDNLK